MFNDFLVELFFWHLAVVMLRCHSSGISRGSAGTGCKLFHDIDKPRVKNTVVVNPTVMSFLLPTESLLLIMSMNFHKAAT